MNWSVFGHGDLTRPSNAWTHGPDAYARSPICRGVHEDCSSYGEDESVSDHCCCTDPCRQAHQNICAANCCRSIPKYICLMFTPDGGQTGVFNCKAKHVRIFMEDTHDRHNLGERSNYRGVFNGVGLVLISVGTPLVGDALYKVAECSWKLEVPTLGVNEEWPVDHHGEINCLAPPTIVIPGVDVPSTDRSGALISCLGSLTTQPYTLAKVPFVSIWPEGQAGPFAYNCGACTELFPVLCVRRNSASGDGPYTFSEYRWSGEKWVENIPVNPQSFEPLEIDGECKISLSGITAPSLKDALIDIDPEQCSFGMILSATAADGEWIEISSRPCACFEYICGTCRCVCPSLCVISSSGGSLSKTQLTWDAILGQWSNGSRYIRLVKDAAGNCQVISPDFVTPAAIPNECGGDMVFTLQDPPPIGGSDFVVGWCVGCGGVCDDGNCLASCDNVPQVLTAEVAGFGFRVEGTEEVKTPCWEVFEVALGLVPVGGSEVAGEWQWRGLTSFVDNDGYTWLFSLSFGCDGNLEWSILDPLGVKDGCSGSDSIEIPCGVVWDFNLAYELTCVCPGQTAGILEIGITEGAAI